MTGKGHNYVGLALSVVGYKIGTDLGYQMVPSLLCCFGIIMGARAPDYLEIWRKTQYGYSPVIPHRTITHWFLAWILLFYLFYSLLSTNTLLYKEFLINYTDDFFIKEYYLNYMFLFLLGWSLGGISHIVVDLPNKKPLPVFTPFDRFSLNLWKSGEFEKIIPFFIFLFSLQYSELIDIKSAIILLINSIPN